MPKYKLVYFNLKARAEDTRLLFAAAGVEYEDSRIYFSGTSPVTGEWVDLKPNFLFRKVPMLEVEGVITLYQSHAIARYVANEFGLAGENNLEKAQVDMIVDAVEGGFDKGIKNYFFTAEENKPEVFRRVFDSQSTLSTCMGNLERLLTANNGGDGFFVGNKLTWADLKFHSCLGDSIKRLNPDFLGKYPKLSSLVDRIENVPSIREWMAKRPNTAF